MPEAKDKKTNDTNEHQNNLLYIALKFFFLGLCILRWCRACQDIPSPGLITKKPSIAQIGSHLGSLTYGVFRPQIALSLSPPYIAYTS